MQCCLWVNGKLKVQTHLCGQFSVILWKWPMRLIYCPSLSFTWSSYLDKAHPNGAHLGKLVDGLKAVVDRLGQKLSKLLIVENLEATSTGDLADSGGVEAVVIITVAALDKNAGVTEALCINLPSHIVQVHTWNTETDQLCSWHSFKLIIKLELGDMEENLITIIFVISVDINIYIYIYIYIRI